MPGQQASEAKRGSFFWENPFDPKIIGIDTNDGPEHPLYDKNFRHEDINFTDAEVEAVLAEGVLQNVEATLMDEAHPDEKIMVFGRRRLLLARKATVILRKRTGDETAFVPVPTIYASRKIYKNAESLRAHVRIENTHRRGLDPMTEAEYIRKDLAASKDIHQVAGWWNLDVRTVENRMALLGLAPEVQAEIRSGLLPPTAALALAKLSVEEQKAGLPGLLAQASVRGDGKARVSTAAAKQLADGKAPIEKKRPPAKMVGWVIDIASEWSLQADVLGDPENSASKAALAALRWSRGQISTEEAARDIPWLPDAVEAAQEDGRKKKTSIIAESAEQSAEA